MRRALVFSLVLASWGCGGSDDSPSASDLWCNAVCSAGSRCGSTEGVSSCSARCAGERPTLADISLEGARPLAACLQDMKCPDLFGDDDRWSAAYDACWSQAKLQLEVTASVRAFCKTYTLAEFDCRYWYATDACERDFGMWTDGIRSRVTACATNPVCTEADACTTAIFDNR